MKRVDQPPVRPFSAWRFWAGVVRGVFRAPPTRRGGGDVRRSFAPIWLLVALVSISASAVSLVQARVQAAVERGVKGSYQVRNCEHRRSARGAVLNSWTCSGFFWPDADGAGRFATLQTDQSRAPTGVVTVMAVRPSSDVVWLPLDVSASRRRMRAVLWFVLVTVPALTMFGFSLARQR
jgi:hypothetical protein